MVVYGDGIRGSRGTLERCSVNKRVTQTHIYVLMYIFAPRSLYYIAIHVSVVHDHVLQWLCGYAWLCGNAALTKG